MDSKKNCSHCSDSDKCSAAYEQAGKFTGPSVVSKVIIAFLLPIIVFIVILASCEKLLPNTLENADLRTALGAVLALAGSLIYIFVARSLLGKNKCSAIQKEK